ncbi:MAG TPA: hypothetical protein VGT02_16835 [Methylomirabilota bacterium]|nr:hypothetical protein [Methylomirabilota bacterium]
MKLALIGLLLLAVAGCAGSLRVAELPTDEQRCAFGSGVFRAGLCDYCR